MASAELARFHRGLRRIDATRSRMEDLFQAKRIRKTDVESVYESLFLRGITGFETFLEQLFISILLGKMTYSGGRVVNLMTVTSKGALMTILLQGGNYMDWLPYRKTEDRAKLYLKDGRRSRI
jgi:hypothetical protein